jgi:hypothetical protein
MSDVIKAKTQTIVCTGEILRDTRGHKYYLRGFHNNKLLVVSMDERKLHMTGAARAIRLLPNNLTFCTTLWYNIIVRSNLNLKNQPINYRLPTENDNE